MNNSVGNTDSVLGGRGGVIDEERGLSVRDQAPVLGGAGLVLGNRDHV